LDQGIIGIAGTVLSVFVLLLIGYGMKKIRLLQPSNCDVLNTVVIYITLPAFIFNAIYEYREPITLDVARIPLIGFAMIALVGLIAYILGRILRFEYGIIAGLILASSFGNTGFLGFPVVEAAFKSKEALFTAVLYDELAMALPLYTIGMVVAAGFMGEKFQLSRVGWVLKLPQMWAIPLAFLLRPFALPEPILAVLKYLANGTIPLVMISLGLSISAKSLKGYTLPVVIACILKLALLPFLTYYAAKMIGIKGIMLQTLTVEAGMPTAMMAGVLVAKFGKSGKYVAGTIFITTMMSLITIPIMLAILK
jgi:predicted permease